MSSKGKHKKRKTRTDDEKCFFCLSTERNLVKYGQMYKFNDIFVHYYCLLFSSGLQQKGEDKEGILGFLEDDIRKEQKRGSKLKCSYCKTNGATIGCVVKTCKVSFHLPCGHNNQALNQFFRRFDSFCVKHRPRQTLEANREVNEECVICSANIKFDEGFESLVTPCCHNLLHRTCLQKQALSAGYFFKCPLCNNEHKFIQTMNELGVFVPKQDASWETENNAFGELYQRYCHCDHEECICPEGRDHKDSNEWQILICDTCGSKGTHWKCRSSDNWVNVWICSDCQTVERRVNRSHNLYNVANSDDSESDIEILPQIVTPSVPKIENKVEISTNNSKQILEINEIPEKRLKSLIKPEMKTIGIQCTLVNADDLEDTEPINELTPYVFKNSIITLNGINKSFQNTEVINIDDSDDEIQLLN